MKFFLPLLQKHQMVVQPIDQTSANGSSRLGKMNSPPHRYTLASSQPPTPYVVKVN